MAYLDYSRYQRGENLLDSTSLVFDSSYINLDTLVVYDNYMSIDGKGDMRGWSMEYWGRNFYDWNYAVVTDIDMSTPYGPVYYRDADWRFGEIGTNTDLSVWVQDLLRGSDEIYCSPHSDTIVGGLAADTIEGLAGDDFIHGQHGADILKGGAGNDTIRGGHGGDLIDAGTGSDWIWGGIGQNSIFVDDQDGLEDTIFVPVDSVKNTVYGNPGGANFDDLWGLGSEDSIFMHGVSDSALTYSASTYENQIGTSIYANGTLEAWVAGLGPGQVDAMTTGGFFA